MGILKIVTYGDPVLEKKGEKVTKFDDNLKQLAEDMYLTMKEAPGIGLAAPQVGKSLQLCLVDLSAGEDKSELLVLINPEIIEAKGEQKGEEGCLSFPGIFAQIERPEKITVKYQDLDGNEQTINAEGLLARAMCHEIDHLNGTVFVNKMGPVKKKMVLKQIKKLKREGKWGN
jgi:peptide deformylase